MQFSEYFLRRLQSLSAALFIIIASFTVGQGALAQPQYFNSPDDAAQMLLKAIKEDDIDGLLAIFGEEGRSIIASGDEQADREARRNFEEAAGQQLRVEELNENQQELIIGDDEWPFPIPLVKEASGWRFDTAAGADELLNRRIGRNELEAIAMMQALSDAQIEYASADRDGDQVLEYAQRLMSSPGQRDGLYWPDETQDDPSPIGPHLEDAGDYLEGKKAGDPWYGYYFRVITKQGANPPGGAYDYVINGNMIAGFALLAFPVQYGDSGVMSFMINQQGVLYQKDLGENTAELVKSISEYNPDESWQVVTDT